jgi:glycosyltransferase involved in cell wall biosynthesis
MSDWLSHGTDAIVLKDPENARELADAVRFLAMNPPHRNAIASNASQTAKSFTWDAHASALRKLMVAAATKKSLRNPSKKSV